MDSDMGSMKVTSDFATNSTGMRQTLDATMTDWGWKKNGTIDLTLFKFKTSADIPTNGGCASFSTEASGSLTVGSRAYTLVGANLDFRCDKITKLYLKVLYEHKVRWNGALAKSHLELSYPVKMFGNKYLIGGVGFSYERHFSKSYEGRTFSRDVSVDFDMGIQLDVDNPAKSSWSFKGDFSADRVSGAIGCSMDGGGKDFTCGGELRLNPSWAGVYHFNWGEM
jgi:hypothetical protein